MTTSLHHTDEAKGYLVVNRFLTSLTSAQALATAFRRGLIDLLFANHSARLNELADHLQVESRGVGLLLQLLRDADVVQPLGDDDQVWQLSSAFRDALTYRDLLEAKLDFALLVAHDYIHLFDQLLFDPGEFQQQSRLMELFRYDRCLEVTDENLWHVRRWMAFTTVLTRYEAEVLLQHCDFAAHQHLLDIGGNSGELARGVCQRYESMRATVFDLPVVCEIGRQYLSGSAAAARIRFRAGDALTDPLPRDADLICFKSMLHDWPEPAARQLLARAAEALRPGGRLIVFERLPLSHAPTIADFHQLPMILFFRSFREPGLYERTLSRCGLLVERQTIELDVPFMLLTAHKAES